jgi:hypothetical protein
MDECNGRSCLIMLSVLYYSARIDSSVCLFRSTPRAGRHPEAGRKRLIPFVILFIRLGTSLDKKVDAHREFSPPSVFPVLKSNVAEKLRFVTATSDYLTTLNGPYFTLVKASFMMVSGNHYRRRQWPLADICREVFLLYLAALEGIHLAIARSVVGMRRLQKLYDYD